MAKVKDEIGLDLEYSICDEFLSNVWQKMMPINIDHN